MRAGRTTGDILSQRLKARAESKDIQQVTRDGSWCVQRCDVRACISFPFSSITIVKLHASSKPSSFCCNCAACWTRKKCLVNYPERVFDKCECSCRVAQKVNGGKGERETFNVKWIVQSKPEFAWSPFAFGLKCVDRPSRPNPFELFSTKRVLQNWKKKHIRASVDSLTWFNV